jgi:type I restriction enzyme M protein
VVAQIQSKRFTQDIIDTLGRRVFELILPIPKDAGLRHHIEEIVRQSIHDRIEARELARRATLLIAEGTTIAKAA